MKRIYRLYVEEGLMVRRKKHKSLIRDRAFDPRLTSSSTVWRPVEWCASRAWWMHTRASAWRWKPDTSLGSGRVTRVLERVISERGRP